MYVFGVPVGGLIISINRREKCFEKKKKILKKKEQRTGENEKGGSKNLRLLSVYVYVPSKYPT